MIKIYMLMNIGPAINNSNNRIETIFYFRLEYESLKCEKLLSLISDTDSSFGTKAHFFI